MPARSLHRKGDVEPGSPAAKREREDSIGKGGPGTASTTTPRPALATAAPTRGLPALSGRDKLSLPGPGRPAPEREKTREKEREAVKHEGTPTAPRAETPSPLATEARQATSRPSPTSSPAPSERPRATLPNSPGGEVQGAVLRHAAHLKIETGPMGTIELHLRVREGALHLRVEGEAARLVESRAGELSRVLAGEGLKLAPIETRSPDAGAAGGGDHGQGGRAFEERREAWHEAADARDRPAATPPTPPAQASPVAADSSGIHVKA